MGGGSEIVYRLSSIFGATMGMDDLFGIYQRNHGVFGGFASVWNKWGAFTRMHYLGAILQRAEGYWI